MILKLTEGVADAIIGNIKDIFMTNAVTKTAALLIKPYFRDLRKKMDASEYGGAPLLGISKPVIKAHGNSNAVAVKHAVRVAADFAAKGVIGQIAAAVKPDDQPQ